MSIKIQSYGSKPGINKLYNDILRSVKRKEGYVPLNMGEGHYKTLSRLVSLDRYNKYS